MITQHMQTKVTGAKIISTNSSIGRVGRVGGSGLAVRGEERERKKIHESLIEYILHISHKFKVRLINLTTMQQNK